MEIINSFAVIFDFNGVIINDERIHQESWRQLLDKYGFKLSEKDFKDKIFGRTEKDVLNYLFKKKISNKLLSKYSSERVKIAINLIGDRFFLAEGLNKFLDLLVKNKIKIALATSSRKPYLNFILDKFNIRKYFEIILSAEDIKHGKPDPEIYLKTAKKLNVIPANCIVFEDSVSGIKSAKLSGMKVIAISTTYNKKELGSADKIITTFKGLTMKGLVSFLNVSGGKKHKNYNNLLNNKLIAPCGMNCGICQAYLRDEKKCPGCFTGRKVGNKPIKCARKLCKKRNGDFCYQCDSFPCQSIKKLDERYQKRYGMSEIENLEFIRDNGIEKFLKNEEKKYSCDNGKGIICVHDKKCYSPR